MKKIIYLIFMILLIPAMAACSDEDEKKNGEVVTFEAKIYPDYESADNSGDIDYIYKGTSSYYNHEVLYIEFQNKSQFGVLQDVPDEVFDWDIPESGLAVVITGIVTTSPRNYSLIPEVTSVDLYVSNIQNK